MEQVGELFKNLPIVKKAVREVAFAESHRKLLDADAVERSYMARQLVQCTLPHRNPGEVGQRSRRNGNFVHAGQDCSSELENRHCTQRWSGVC